MRRARWVWIVALAGCGGADTSAGPPPLPQEPPAAEESMAAPAEPSRECADDRECTTTYFDDVLTSEAQCRCPTCGYGSVPLERARRIERSFESVCADWRTRADCPPVSCTPATTRPRCVEGRCEAVPIASPPAHSGT